jgi:glucuronoarabinoxylan endo-1,4-beta-xylanase
LQGSNNPHTIKIGQYVLMAGTTVGKKYYASKHFYRFIRLGAKRVEAAQPHSDVFVTA